MGRDIQDIIELIRESGDLVTALANLLEMGIAGVILAVSIISFIASALFNLAVWILEAIPVYSISKKLGRPYAWLAWVPVFGAEFRLWVLCDMPANKPVVLFQNKGILRNRTSSFWIYLAIAYLGAAVISTLVAVISVFIPVIGSLSAVLMLIPTVACAYFEYIYLRDVLDIFKPDKKSNSTNAIVVTVLDTLFTAGFARVFILYTIMKKKPLPAAAAGPYDAYFTRVDVC